MGSLSFKNEDFVESLKELNVENLAKSQKKQLSNLNDMHEKEQNNGAANELEKAKTPEFNQRMVRSMSHHNIVHEGVEEGIDD